MLGYPLELHHCYMFLKSDIGKSDEFLRFKEPPVVLQCVTSLLELDIPIPMI
jgi:hypothetical protein